MASDTNVDVPGVTLESPADVEAPEEPPNLKTEPVPDSFRPPSLFTSAASARPSWYTTWIGWGTSTPQMAPSASAGDVNTEPGPGSNQMDEMTEAQQIEAEALARANVPAPPPLPAVEPSPVIMSETRASWVSFFSSRNLTYTKTITDGSDMKGEMEVMDIDEEDTPTGTNPTAASFKGTLQNPLATPNATKTNLTLPTPTPVDGRRTTSPSPSNDSDRNRSDAPSPTHSSGMMPPSKQTSLAPAAPLTGSKDVKKQISSTKAAKDAIPKPKMPNFVLPSWGDTFYSAPRNFRPPTNASTLKKTFDAVSRLLIAPASPSNPELENYLQERKKRLVESLSRILISPSKSPEVYEEEQRRMARIVGTDLPRARSIMGDGIHGSDIDAVKRIVIIGIHGCVMY